MINDVFDACVRVLETCARWLGITYKEINVWIFVILWPLFTLVLLLIVILQQRKIRHLRRGRS